MLTNLYETDFYAWTLEQSQLLQQGKWQALDIENLVEEIESLGRQQRQELRNRLGVLIGHLLKWDYQSNRRCKTWKATIREQRKEVLRVMKENPSLQPYLPEAIAEAYDAGLAIAVRETPLDYKDLPSECPYMVEQILDLSFPVGLLD
jgi:Domain of unknown function DUF29